QVECCGGPPIRKSTMHDFALPPVEAPPADSLPAARNGAASRSPGERPNRPSPPARSISRRAMPSHRRVPGCIRWSMEQPPGMEVWVGVASTIMPQIGSDCKAEIGGTRPSLVDGPSLDLLHIGARLDNSRGNGGQTPRSPYKRHYGPLPLPPVSPRRWLLAARRAAGGQPELARTVVA